MARGRKPTPTSLKVLRGNPGKRRLPEGEIQPLAGHLAPPDYLSGTALAHWEQTAPLLHAYGLLTQLDTMAWGMASTTWGLFLEARAIVAQDGQVVATFREGEKKHPAATLLRSWADLYLKLAIEFGMTPTARVALHVGRIEPDALASFLRESVARKTKAASFATTVRTGGLAHDPRSRARSAVLAAPDDAAASHHSPAGGGALALIL
jgi:P27 family predicted phage terminase small subunit